MKEQEQELLRDISKFISATADELPSDLRTHALALQVRISLAVAGLNLDQLLHSPPRPCDADIVISEVGP
ncbi:TPA: hypothetical protein NI610_006803 [Pseudomonas aeruginosa]|nr:hypothetical protein [Pseudomonas aeruginosa]